MTDDGKVDYARYSTAELHEALEAIDRARFPRNFSNLTRELASRPGADVGHARAPAPLFDERTAWRIFFAGWAVFAAGLALVYWASTRYEELPNYLRIGIVIPLTLATVMLHVHALRDMASASFADQARAVGAVLAFVLVVMGTVAWLAFAPGVRG